MREKVSNTINVQAILSEYTPEELAKIRKEGAKEDERRKKISPVYLQIAFGFVDEEGKPARPKDDTYPYLTKIPLDVSGDKISFVEQLIIEKALTSMIQNLILSGQIDHLCPRVRDIAPKNGDKSYSTNPPSHLEVVSCSAQIQEITDSPFSQNIQGVISLSDEDTSSCKHSAFRKT